MPMSREFIPLILLVTAAALLGCLPFASVTLTPSPTHRPSPPSPEPLITVIPSATPRLPVGGEDTPAPEPTPTVLGEVTPVVFPPGTTGVVIGCVELESLPPQTAVVYRLWVMGGQLMRVLVSPATLSVAEVEIRSPAGEVIGQFDLPDTLGWEAVVSQSGNYEIYIRNAGEEEWRYSLEIDVPGWLELREGVARAEGVIVGCAEGEYLVRLERQGTLTVAVTSPAEDLVLTVMGMSDRSPYVRDVMMLSRWEGAVPAQMYLIRVIPRAVVEGKVSSAFREEFVLEVSVGM